MWNSMFLCRTLETSDGSLGFLGKGGPINLFGVGVGVNLGSRNGGDESENGVLVHDGVYLFKLNYNQQLKHLFIKSDD